MESFVYRRLSADPEITAIVGDHIFPVYPAQDTPMPVIVFTRTGTDLTQHLGGTIPLKKHTIQIDLWTKTFSQGVDLATKVKAALDGYRDDTIQGCFLADQTNEEDETVYHGTQTYSIWSA